MSTVSHENHLLNKIREHRTYKSTRPLADMCVVHTLVSAPMRLSLPRPHTISFRCKQKFYTERTNFQGALESRGIRERAELNVIADSKPGPLSYSFESSVNLHWGPQDFKPHYLVRQIFHLVTIHLRAWHAFFEWDVLIWANKNIWNI